MRNYIVILILSVASILLATAQDVFHPEQHELMQITNQWISSNNAAGLSISDIKIHGNSELGYRDNSGEYHRAQEGNRFKGLHFFSERFDKINKNWTAWGSFDFQMNSEYNRTWSNVFHTYNHSPYLFGDTIKAKYDTQFFDLHAKLSRRIDERWAVGVGLDYFAGDMSRQRDARIRTFLANYAVIPSVTFKVSDKHTVGLTTSIRYEKEKMPGITTVKTDPKIDYYFFLGNENTYSVLDGYKGFDREYTNLDYSVGLQYNLKNKNLDWLNSINLEFKNQEILGSERESPGSYASQTVSFDSKANVFLENKLLNVSFSGNHNLGSADEFLQELITEPATSTTIASKKWVTLYAYNNRYTTDSYTADLNISLRNLLKNRTDYSWTAAFESQLLGFSNKYYLPYSAFETQRLRMGISGGMRLLNKKNHIISLNAKGGYAFSLLNNLQLNSIATDIQGIGATTFQTATYKIAHEILIPDNAFYNENVYDYKLEARYSFPIKVKNNKLAGIAKIFYGNQLSAHLGSWMNIGISLGLITL